MRTGWPPSSPPGSGNASACWWKGWTRPGIATKLGVSAATVRTHVQSVMTKLGVHSRLEAASYAVRYGLLDDEESHFRSTGTGLARGQPPWIGPAKPSAGVALAPRAGTVPGRTGDTTACPPCLPQRAPLGRCPVSPRLRLVTRLGGRAGDPAPCPGEFCYLIHYPGPA